MYNALAPLYDTLFEDSEASESWAKLVQDHVEGKKVLELACGSGDIAQLLNKAGYDVLATDISKEMLEEAQRKYPMGITWKEMDMLDLNDSNLYDAVICFCDSLNYVCNEDALIKHFRQVYHSLVSGGSYIFDVHSLDRKVEFEEPYIETGVVEDIPYQWEIFCEDDRLYQQFAFYYEEGTQLESHVQVIWDPMLLKEQLESIGFDVKIKTDFELDGIQEGEKYFFVATKGG